jgi:hypothetical protein
MGGWIDEYGSSNKKKFKGGGVPTSFIYSGPSKK